MDAPNMTKAEIYNEQYDSAVNLQKTNESWDCLFDDDLIMNRYNKNVLNHVSKCQDSS